MPARYVKLYCRGGFRGKNKMLLCQTQYFYPMGDGLFCAGELASIRDDSLSFLWVFDCGTLDGKDLLKRELARFESAFRNQPVNMFSMSHFDMDHVVGAEVLLGQFYVDVLVLPYLTLTERMLIASGIKSISPEYLRLLIDPAAYFSEVSENKNIRIVFIRGGGRPPDSRLGERPINPFERDDRHFGLVIPSGDDYDDEDPSGVLGTRNISVVSHHKPFCVGAEWEFMFYNESRLNMRLEALRNQVRTTVRANRQADGKYDGRTLIQQLKQIYSKQFGRTAAQKNRISLVKYSGPIPSRQPRKTIGGTWTQHSDEEFYAITLQGYPGIASVKSTKLEKPSVLHTGDIYFNTKPRVEAAKRHFGNDRWSQIGILQVPHHGSRHSWFQGAASVFAHEISVFSARSGKVARPHANVRTDLGGTSLRFANEYQGVGTYQLVKDE